MAEKMPWGNVEKLGCTNNYTALLVSIHMPEGCLPAFNGKKNRYIQHDPNANIITFVVVAGSAYADDAAALTAFGEYWMAYKAREILG